MNYDEIRERQRGRDHGEERCFLTKANPPMFALEWRSGKRRMLPWAHFKEAVFEDGRLVLVFAGQDIVVHGLNLGELADAIEEARLAKIWEQNVDHRPPVGCKLAAISRIERRDTTRAREEQLAFGTK